MSEQQTDRPQVRLEGIHALRQVQNMRFGVGEEFPPGERKSNISWDFLFDRPGTIHVLFGAVFEPTEDVKEELRADMVGVFSWAGEMPREQLIGFAQYAAPRIMMPYIREAIFSLSRRGPFGALNLQPMLMSQFMSGMNPELTTAHSQLEDDPGLLVGPKPKPEPE